jgi:IS5 family transposase
MSQPGFFDLNDRLKKLNERDPLISLNELIEWEDFRATLETIRIKKRKSKAGRKPFDCVLMFKALILQHLYNLSDEELEYQIRDRYSFCRFLGLSPEGTIPDARTIWLFREQLTQGGLIKELFLDFDIQLDEQGYKARKGQIVDASFVDAPKQRNSRDENEQIKNGETPERFESNPNVKRQKDVDARWTKKNNQTFYGYKNHITVDNQHKLIRNYEVTSAEVHDSKVFFELLADNNSTDVWADSAYRSEENEVTLAASGYRSHVHKKGYKDRPLSDRDTRANTKKSKVRARVEHVFGSIENEQGGLLTRVIGLARTTLKVGMTNLVYNMRRLITLHRISVSSV